MNQGYKSIRRLLIGAIVCGASLVLATTTLAREADGDAVIIRLLPTSEVAGTHFTLGEVAEFDGFDLEAVKALAGVSLGRSPRPGGRMRLNETQVRSRVSRVIDPARVQVNMPPLVWVKRAAQRVAGKEIEAKVRARARNLAGQQDTGLRQSLIAPIPDAVLPLGPVSWEIKPLGRYMASGGTRTFRVVAKVNGHEAWRTLARVKQEVIVEIVVAARPIRRDQIITAKDLKLETHNLSGKKTARFSTAPDTLIGRRAKRPIGEGEWIHDGLAENVSSVRQGGRVKIVYRTDRLYFSMPGVAMVSGGRGDFIPVRNLQSGRIVHGVIVGRTTVKVN